MHQVLKLNQDYQPMEIISWQDAIGLWWNDKVEIVTEYDDFDLKSVSFTMKCPAVVRLLEYVGWKRHVKYSRKSIYGRDHYTCQYCGVQPGSKDLNLDHVIPRKRGGLTTWENIVTSCCNCNSRKADRTLVQAGMHLRRQPYKPSPSKFLKMVFNIPKTPTQWRDYLYWNQELENDND